MHQLVKEFKDETTLKMAFLLNCLLYSLFLLWSLRLRIIENPDHYINWIQLISVLWLRNHFRRKLPTKSSGAKVILLNLHREQGGLLQFWKFWLNWCSLRWVGNRWIGNSFFISKHLQSLSKYLLNFKDYVSISNFVVFFLFLENNSSCSCYS